jgi:hypothetical protein
MKIYTLLSLLSFLLLTQTSCLTTKTDVGNFRESQGETYTYAKAKQFWIFGGLIPLGRTNTATPPDKNCRIITRFNIVDFLISGLTGGLVMTRTIKVVARRPIGVEPVPTPRPTEPKVEPTDEPKVEPKAEPSEEPKAAKPKGKFKAFTDKTFKKKDK